VGGSNVKTLVPFVVLAAICGLIWFLGTGRFGRAQTQAWIERLRSRPRLYAFVDRHHGKFRALGHYVEFGGLFLVLYWLYDTLWGSGRLSFAPLPAVVIAVSCAAAALLDELHQLQSGTRQFRRVDFLHSCCGIAIACLVVQYQALLRGY